MWRWLPIALVGCYAPQPPIGAPCGDGRLCPSGQTCVALADGDRCLADGDGSPDADPDTCVAKRLLTGGVDVAAQGWEIVTGGGGVVVNEGATTRMQTAGNSRQLIVLRDALPTDRFVVDIVLEVVSSGGHAPGEAAVALMGSFHDPVGDPTDRDRMIFLDTDALGWGDESVDLGFDTKRVVTYRLERTATGAIKLLVMVGGTISISKSPFPTNGTLAIGDQTTVTGLDSIIRITSVDRVCP